GGHGVLRVGRLRLGGPGIRSADVIIPAVEGRLMGLVVLLLVIWLALSVLGFVVEGLVWLAIVGVVLFLVTGAWSFARRGVRR
ncbi:hypothetical protein, partial [Kibdelosporangium persicum]|uniref:hypothetical protein n=2 Tax=Kibdelosporangium persicum TaxID=2698649 RepID=UPI0039F12CC3